MAERKGQLAAEPDIEPFALAQIEETILQMEIAVTHAAGGDAHQDFTALWFRQGSLRLGERLSIGEKGLADHDASFPRACAMRAKSVTVNCSARRLGSIPRFSRNLLVSG